MCPESLSLRFFSPMESVFLTVCMLRLSSCAISAFDILRKRDIIIMRRWLPDNWAMAFITFCSNSLYSMPKLSFSADGFSIDSL